GGRRGTPGDRHSAPRAPREIRGRQYRVRGGVRARLLGELEASVYQRPATRRPPPATGLPEPGRIIIIPGAASPALTTCGECVRGVWTRGFVFPAGPILPRLRPNGPRREFANSITFDDDVACRANNTLAARSR